MGILIFLTGCMAMLHGTAQQLNNISVGMTKEEVLHALGAPASTAAHAGGEFMIYRWMEGVVNTWNPNSPNAWPQEYYVFLEHGRVTSYGRKGDFGSATLPSTNINIKKDVTIREDQPPSPGMSPSKYDRLEQLFRLKEQGAITEAEYQQQKTVILGQ
jgi:hypothetical protein